ncbi:MAG: hypothetical protein ABR555_19305 [Pyrinomonadaceae bacterium]
MFEQPPVTPFVECPNCKQLLEYGVANCPRCREEIDPQYAMNSAVVIGRNTQACSLAKTIVTAEPAIFISIAVAGAAYLSSGPGLLLATLVTPVISLVAITAWYWRYGNFKLGDEEYRHAPDDVYRSFVLWFALLAVQILVILYKLKNG